jgi:hypothetical protein
MNLPACYRQVWAGDFEFSAPMGERPVPVCCVARELRTGRLERLWLADGAPALPPYGTGPDSLFIAYYASAELGCHLALGWPMPCRILDLWVEFKNRTCGLSVPCGRGLLGALAYFGLDAIDAAEKEEMRQLAMRGGPYTAAEQWALLDYCQTDVDALARLLPRMLRAIDLPRALLRGRYMAALARMEWAGVPIDTEALARLVAAVNADYAVFVPAGQRAINPESTLGAALLQEAEAWGIDPHRLADVVDAVWAEERQASAEVFAARQAARKVTGLTVNRLRQWEESGKDHSLFPRLDVLASDLAGAYPALGIGRGYDPDAPDDTDLAGRLWEVLRDRSEKPKPKHHPDILRRAAELVAGGAGDGESVWGPMRFSAKRWAAYLARKQIPWPRLPSGALDLEDDTFAEMAKAYPKEVGPIRELRHTLAQLRLNELAVGSDGRNRLLLSAFASKTARNQPSNSGFIFGPSVWLRGLIRPSSGRAVAYVDWNAQEYAIAASLSGDPVMQADYRGGDPYLAFGKRIGVVPPDATKASHGEMRERLKVCCGLGAMYGAGPGTLASLLGVPECQARYWLQAHRAIYTTYWRWSDRTLDRALLTGRMRTCFGWSFRVGPATRPTTVRNWMMQSHASEMLRLACCRATELGLMVCAPVHDALLVEGAADEIEAVVARTQEAMGQASELVLPGFPLRTEAKIVRHPDRYADPRGQRLWDAVWALVGELADPDTPCTGAGGPPARLHPPPSLIPCLSR